MVKHPRQVSPLSLPREYPILSYEAEAGAQRTLGDRVLPCRPYPGGGVWFQGLAFAVAQAYATGWLHGMAKYYLTADGRQRRFYEGADSTLKASSQKPKCIEVWVSSKKGMRPVNTGRIRSRLPRDPR